MSATTEMSSDWRAVLRREEHRGETRAAALRIVGVLLFYLVHVLHRHGYDIGPLVAVPVAVDDAAHAIVTTVTTITVLTSLSVIVLLELRYFPAWLKYLTTALDTMMLAAALAAVDGPSSPLMVAYFPVLVLSAVRFSRALVRFATSASILSYLGLVAFTARMHPEHLAAPHAVALTLVAMGLVGGALDLGVGAGLRIAGELRARGARPAEKEAA